MRKITLVFILLAVSLISFAMPISQQSEAMIKQFVEKKYPGAVIVDREVENGNIEIEIIHQGKEKDLLFDGNGKWVKSKWEVLKSELPSVVQQAIKSSPFKSYSIDDIDYQESPASVFYKVDLEKWIGDREAVLYITPEGQIL